MSFFFKKSNSFKESYDVFYHNDTTNPFGENIISSPSGEIIKNTAGILRLLQHLFGLV